MPTIFVSRAVLEGLKKRSRSWKDTPAKTIQKLLEMNVSKKTMHKPVSYTSAMTFPKMMYLRNLNN